MREFPTFVRHPSVRAGTRLVVLDIHPARMSARGSEVALLGATTDEPERRRALGLS